MKKIHIVIIHYKTKDLTVQCLNSLMADTIAFSSDFTVVDNGSKDGSAEALRRLFPKADIFESQENLGFARACNLAISKDLNYEYFLFVNSDTITPLGTLQKMLNFMEGHKDCGILGPKLIYENGKVQNSFSPWPSLKEEFWGRGLCSFWAPSMYPSKRQLRDKPLEVQSLVGAYMMIRTKDFILSGGFDERYFFFLEETDLCRKVITLGKKVICHPEIAVIHLQGASANKKPGWSRHQFYRSKYQFFQKWEGPFSLALIYFKNLLSFCFKVCFYFIFYILSLGTHERALTKTKVSRWLLWNHFLGFPPYFSPPSRTLFHKDGLLIMAEKDPESRFSEMEEVLRTCVSIKIEKGIDYFLQQKEDRTRVLIQYTLYGRKKKMKKFVSVYDRLKGLSFNSGELLAYGKNKKDGQVFCFVFIEFACKTEPLNQILQKESFPGFDWQGTKFKRLLWSQLEIKLEIMKDKNLNIPAEEDSILVRMNPGSDPAFEFYFLRLDRMRLGFFNLKG